MAALWKDYDLDRKKWNAMWGVFVTGVIGVLLAFINCVGR